ncbi:GNAT family N-acetyltransferase [Actinocorallia sp. A-T 12471]|uniref:GNAT family N-acetyltransferase n=1 Tax=Actinocorallia sp. A-T 12471 TaxID=3089813 RepID=UPI0029D26D67|nr:GNAT family N-acetyltransferase [Actinocorallia sp. A-T 12471]MDX6743993.1 GNAT family N-acetyltransferase [Actinocorallia sp. A-T 12471]
MPEVVITDVPERERFEAHLDGVLAGFAEYMRGPSLVVYPHTVVHREYEGKGVGSALARAVLDDARARGLKVLPTCPFIAAWMLRTPGYAELAYQARSTVSD